MTNSLDSRESEWTDEAPKARFWKRYSPHHEASISGSSSIVLHILCFGVLILSGLLIALGSEHRPVEVSPIVMAGGGRSRETSREPNPENQRELINGSVTESEAKLDEMVS